MLHSFGAQEVANRLAVLCLRACAALGGLSGELEQPHIRAAVSALVTPYVTHKLAALAALRSEELERAEFETRERALLAQVLKVRRSRRTPYFF